MYQRHRKNIPVHLATTVTPHGRTSTESRMLQLVDTMLYQTDQLESQTKKQDNCLIV